MGAETEVTVSFTSMLLTTQEDGVASSGSTESKLIKSQNFTTSLQDASTSRLGKTKGGNGKLGDSQQTLIISNGSDDNGSFTLERSALTASKSSNLRNRDRRAVGLGLKKTLQNCLVETRIRTTGQESVQFYQKLQVHILGGRLAALRLSDVVSLDVNTLINLLV